MEWAEISRNQELQDEANRGLDSLANAFAAALTRGQRANRVPHDLDPDDGARLLLSLLPGIILQRAATGDNVAAAVARAVTALLDGCAVDHRAIDHQAVD